MKAKVIPLVYYDGLPTFRDSDMINFYHRTIDEELNDSMFFDGGIKNVSDFLTYMKSNNVLFLTLNIDGKTAGFGWLSHFDQKMARGHFCIFKEFWGRPIHDAFNEMAGQILQYTGLDLIMGIIPSVNIKAVKFVLKCGYRLVGEIPCGCIDKDGNPLPSTIVYYAR